MKCIYIYETLESKEKGLIKIGDAENVEKRIKEQLNTAAAFDASSLSYTLLYQTEAIKSDGTEFRDHKIHSILEKKGYYKHKIYQENLLLKNDTEWFQIDVDKAINLIEKYKQGFSPEQIDIDRFQDFPMRPEQEQAVLKTEEYFSNASKTSTPEMLWNAKMRFGKTFTAYQLVKKMKLQKTLILTYKPAVESAWKEDLNNHIDFEDYVFLSGDSLFGIREHLENKLSVVAFASYQDLLGNASDGSKIKERHKDLIATDWDIVIIDEFHYGAGTEKAEALKDENEKNEDPPEEDEHLEEEKIVKKVISESKKLKTKHRLYLSGTPFKAISDDQFKQEAIFNWTYADEQKAKEEWDSSLGPNPYLTLPKINMYLYKVSDELISAGQKEDKDEFSLNHFFRTKDGKFEDVGSVRNWLDLISGYGKSDKYSIDNAINIHLDEDEPNKSQFPFDPDSGIYKELNHTLWYLNRVDSARALKELIEEHPFFGNGRFKVILAAGNEMKSGVDAVSQLKDFMEKHDRTITLSVGKLTTGVSVPKWTGVLFLRDTSSPADYFQTAFRAQTPYKFKNIDGLDDYKKNCYVFDFSPTRALKLLTTYSEKLSENTALTSSQVKIAELIKYLPVLKVSGNKMVAMDAKEVLTFDLSGMDSKGLGGKFIDKKNIRVNNETINFISSNPENLSKCQAIFNKIKNYRKKHGASEIDQKNMDADIYKLNVNNNKIKELKTKTTSNEKVIKEVAEGEKILKSERDKIKELLKTLLSRLPIFMYLTDATEENLEQVLVDTEDNLFRKTTGITIQDFAFLREMGLIKIDNIDGYILKFVELENEINNQTNMLSKSF